MGLKQLELNSLRSLFRVIKCVWKCYLTCFLIWYSAHFIFKRTLKCDSQIFHGGIRNAITLGKNKWAQLLDNENCKTWIGILYMLQYEAGNLSCISQDLPLAWFIVVVVSLLEDKKKFGNQMLLQYHQLILSFPNWLKEIFIFMLNIPRDSSRLS